MDLYSVFNKDISVLARGYGFVVVSVFLLLLPPVRIIFAQQPIQRTQSITDLERSQILTILFHPIEILGKARLDSLRLVIAYESSAESQRRSRSRRAVPDSTIPDNEVLAEARVLISRGNTTAARELLDVAFKQGDPHSEVPFLLAELYVAEPDPGGRQRAEELIAEALRRSPGNIRYRLTRVRIFRGRTLNNYAERELDRILRDIPTQAEALAIRGQFRVERLTNADWRKSGWGDDIERQFVSREERTALENLATAIAIDSLNVRAHHWLAYFNLHRQEWKSAMRVCNRMMELGIEPAMAHLGRGLALFHLRLYDDAKDAFEAASRHLEPGVSEMIWAPLWATPIIDADRTGSGAILDQERAVSASGDSIFWATLDPLLSDDVNLRALEQARRFAHVAWFYGVETLGLQGWETLMGQIYLRYGEPISQSSIRMRQELGARLIDAQAARVVSGGSLSTLPLNVEQFPSQKWDYGEFVIPLGLGFLSGNLEFIIQKPPGPGAFDFPNYVDSSELYQKLTQTRPEISTIVGVPHPKHFQLTSYTFPGPANTTDVASVMEVDENLALSLLWGVSGFENEPLLHAITFDLESGKKEVETQSVFEQNRRWSSLPYFSKKYVLASPSMNLMPGKYLLSLELVSSSNQNWVGRDSIAVSAPESPLRISDLILASAIEPDTTSNLWSSLWPSAGTINRSGWRIAPRLSRTFTPGERKMLFVEFDGLQKDEFGATSYELALSVTQPQRRGILAFTAQLIDGITGRSRGQEQITWLWERTGILERDTEVLTIVIPDPEDDEYTVTLSITDHIANSTVSTQSIMQISRKY